MPVLVFVDAEKKLLGQVVAPEGSSLRDTFQYRDQTFTGTADVISSTIFWIMSPVEPVQIERLEPVAAAVLIKLEQAWPGHYSKI